MKKNKKCVVIIINRIIIRNRNYIYLNNRQKKKENLIMNKITIKLNFLIKPTYNLNEY